MEFILDKLYAIPAILLAFTVQGYAKSVMAYKLGDKAQRLQGRMNLNPVNHIDPIGFIMILIFRFGFTKHLDINTSAFKRPYKDDLKVRLAAPIANFVTAAIFAAIYGIFIALGRGMLSDNLFTVLNNMIIQIMIINVSLGIFILLPLPGLEGFYIFRDLSPKNFYKVADTMYQLQIPILLGVVLVGQKILSIPVNFIFYDVMLRISDLFSRLF